ncbi:YrrS family protein [Jeotgalibacillus sp. JSM ZJ347]|uniref:YrrS family protein n=1 Tax=Jeotgalibacillus sp. JSM ZJ347 TaxID=3342117 RepID=UPI0035A91ADA
MNNSRSDIQSKKRKQNIFLNASIAVVFLLIAGVSAFIFLGDNENQAAETEEKTIAEQVQEKAGLQDENENEPEGNENNELTASEIESEDENNETEQAAASDESEKEEETADEKKEKEKKKKSNQNDEETERPEDGKWKPVGTEQTGEHVSSYDEGSVDWNEKLKAAAYATGLDMNAMTVWWVGNNGGPQKAVVEVSSPSAGAAEFRVQMEWVDQKGWKPVKVDEL